MELSTASLLALLVAVLLHVLLRSLGSKPRRKAALVPGEKARAAVRPCRRSSLRAQVELALVHRENISPDTRLLRFALPVRRGVADDRYGLTSPSRRSTFSACP